MKLLLDNCVWSKSRADLGPACAVVLDRYRTVLARGVIKEHVVLTTDLARDQGVSLD